MRLSLEAVDQRQCCQIVGEPNLVVEPLGELGGSPRMTSGSRQIVQHAHEGGRQAMLGFGP